jgi:hypothetical protein
MPIIRNPFRRQDENARPNATVVEKPANATAPPKSIDLGEKQDTEYKLSGRSHRANLLRAHVS